MDAELTTEVEYNVRLAELLFGFTWWRVDAPGSGRFLFPGDPNKETQVGQLGIEYIQADGTEELSEDWARELALYTRSEGAPSDVMNVLMQTEHIKGYRSTVTDDYCLVEAELPYGGWICMKGRWPGFLAVQVAIAILDGAKQ